MSRIVAPESVPSNNIERRMVSIGSGDNVMAELQNKLKGRGKISPTHSHSIRTASSSSKLPPLTTGHSSNGDNIKMMQIRLQNTSPTENTTPQLNDTSTSPTTITIDISTASGIRKEEEKGKDGSSLKLKHSCTLSAPNLDVNKLTQPINSTHSVSATDVNSSIDSSLYDQGGVKQLARIFSARSRGETTPYFDSSETSPKASLTSLHSSNDNDKIHPYQNVSADQWSPPPNKITPTTNQISPKKPIPTPRKSSPGAPSEVINTKSGISSSNEEEEDDGYEFVDISGELQNELNMLEEVVNLPPLGQQLSANTKSSSSPIKPYPPATRPHLKVTKSSSGNVIPRRNSPRLLKELRRGVVTDGDNSTQDEYITMNILKEEAVHIHGANENQDSYLTVLENSPVKDNEYMTMRRPSDFTQSTTPTLASPKSPSPTPKELSSKSSDISIGWKRTQGSLFAQEMIDTLYCQISEKGRGGEFCSLEESDDGGSQSYIDIYEIPGNFLSTKKSTCLEDTKQPTGPPPPVPNRPLVGPAAPKIDQHGNMQVPLLPPKSESMLREVLEDNAHLPIRGITNGKSKIDKKKLKINKSLPLISSVKTKHVISAPVISSSPSSFPSSSLSPSFSPSVSPSVSPSFSPSSSPSGNVRKVINVLRKETFSEEKSAKKLFSESFPSDEKPRKPLPLPTRKTEPVLSPPIFHTDFTSLDGNSDHTHSPKSSPRLLRGGVTVTTKTPLERKAVVKRRPRKEGGQSNFSDKINRDSLVVILHNHDVIMKHLKKRSLEKNRPHPLEHSRSINKDCPINQSNDCSPHEPVPGLIHTHSSDLGTTTLTKDTLVQSLGELLVEMSSLLKDEKDEETEEEKTLISTIEQELQIKLHTNPSYLKRTTPAKQYSGDDASEDYHDLTEEDVRNVVKYFDDNIMEQEHTQEDNQYRADLSSSSSSSSPYFSSRKSFLSRSNSDAILLDEYHRSGSLKSLHSNPEVRDHGNDLSPDLSQSVSMAAENLINGGRDKYKLRHTSSVTSNDIHSLSTNVSCNGVGYFTSVGGTITSKESGVIVEVPPGAVAKGRRQKIWFEVHQTVYKESDEDDIYHSLGSFSDRRKSDNSSKKESRIQCSPIVSIGPTDLMLHKPLKINIPHCVPYDSSAWNLKVKGRGHGSSSHEWMSLSPATSSSSLFSRPGGPRKSFKSATYQLNPNYVRVKTKLSGYYRLVGRPMTQNGNKVVKNMVCSIYAEKEGSEEAIRIKVFFVNAILDSVEALDRSLTSDGYQCIERNIPLLCYGNQSDFKVNLSMDTPAGRTTLKTQIIPYGMLWRVTRVGYSRVTFELTKPQSSLSSLSIGSNHLYSLKVLQADKESLQLDFMLPQI